MSWPQPSRRRFLQGMGMAALSPWACGGEEPQQRMDGTLVSAFGGDDVGLATWDGAELRTLSTGFRGHGLAWTPHRPDEVVLFQRRPGVEVAVIGLKPLRIRRRLRVHPQRRLQGHGDFSRDGSLLFSSEADVETGAGAVGVWDAETLQLLDVLDSGGIGPHELRTLPDGGALVVANGGLLTRPETGSQPLNLDTMDPSLAYIDMGSGRIDEQLRLVEPKASIRHLDIAADGAVVVGTQVQRQALGGDAVAPLAAVHRRGQSLVEIGRDDPLMVGLADYVGSVTVGGDIAGFTSPRGDLVLFYSIETAERLGQHRLSDVCGLASDPGSQRFILSSSVGEVRSLSQSDITEHTPQRRRWPGVRWDNHLSWIPRTTS